jgi:serine/threonine protein kinase
MFRSKNSYDVVIVDFGLSTFVTEKSYLFYRCGTPGFMAPEMLRAKKNVRRPADPIGDIFSLGIIFHILYFLFVT